MESLHLMNDIIFFYLEKTWLSSKPFLKYHVKKMLQDLRLANKRGIILCSVLLCDQIEIRRQKTTQSITW